MDQVVQWRRELRITEARISKELADPVGLKVAKLTKLGSVVLLAGKNGSGKTRLLTLIRDQAANLHNFKNQKTSAPSQIQNHKNNIRSWQQQMANQSDNREQVANFETAISQAKASISQYEHLLQQPEPIVSDHPDGPIAVIDFVPKIVELQDWANFAKNEWMNRANQAKSIGVQQLHSSSIPMIQQVMERWVNTSHPSLEFSETERSDALAEYNRLQEIVSKFLGTKIGWNKDGYSTLFGRPIAQSQLSDGQRVILQLCVAIFAQGGTFSNHVIFMDEPENHLHPSAVIDLLDAIREQSPNGQLWIATHSIPLLSHFDESAVWYLEEGAVSHAGRKPEKVLAGLLGDEGRILRLRDFTGLPADLARNRFAFECLQPPAAVLTTPEDPQIHQLYEQLKVIWKEKETINILDFGAGKGRLIANMADYDAVSSQSMNYFAYDLNPDDRDTCIQNISSVFDDPERRYFSSIESLRSAKDDEFFDVVVMCNVLHEIEHSKWLGIFKTVQTVLRPEGFLLIIEDCRLPVGELPNKSGFVVMNTLHLRKLFQIGPDEERFVSHDARFDSPEDRGRLMAHLIPRHYLGKANIESVRRSINELKVTSIREIAELRGKLPSYRAGLSHAFWVQQLANATLVLSELE